MANVKAIVMAATVLGAGIFGVYKFAGSKKKDPTITYPIQSGDCVIKLAEKYNMTADEFRTAASLKNDNLKIGDTLRINTAIKLSDLKSKEQPVAATATNPQSSAAGDKTKVYLGNGKTFTRSSLQADAIRGGIADIKNKIGVNPATLVRPLPNLNSNGRIEARTELLKPASNSTNELKGKTIIVNAGHGGYDTDNGFFDSGAIGTGEIKVGDKIEKAPIEEWRHMEIYANDLAERLRKRGATVIFLSGKVNKGGMSKQKFLENLLKGNAGVSDVKNHMKSQKNENLMLISLHADSSSNTDETGSAILYFGGDDKDKRLADLISNGVNNVPSRWTNCKSRSQNVYIVRETGRDIPGVLAEVEYLTGTKSANVGSSDYRKKFLDGTEKGILEYFNIQGAKPTTGITVPASTTPASTTPAATPAPATPAKPTTTASTVANGKPSLSTAAISYIAKETGLSELFIKDMIQFEGVHNATYVDNNGTGSATIGVGHKLSEAEKTTYKNKTLTDDEIAKILITDLKSHHEILKRNLGDAYGKLNWKQKEALVDMVFNKGTTNLTAIANALKEDDKDKAASLISVNYSLKSKDIQVGLCERRMYDIYRFCNGNIGTEALKTAQRMYNEGRERVAANKLPEFNANAKKWFGDKITVKP